MTASDLTKIPSTTLMSPVSSMGLSDESIQASLDALPISKALFQKLFPAVVGSKSVYNDVRAYGLLTHVRESANSGGAISIAVSCRGGPPGLSKPARVISHLVSLAGVAELDTTGGSASTVAMVSLHTWDWMCIPTAAQSPNTILAALDLAVSPLAVPTDKIPIGTDPASVWMASKLQAGYVIKPYKGTTGSQLSVCLIRGPLLPRTPAMSPSSYSLPDYSEHGRDLVQIDNATGMADLTYASAWAAGRSIALGDKAFLASLVRLRSKIREKAVSLSKDGVRSGATTGNGWTNAGFLNTLTSVVSQIDSAHAATNLPKNIRTPSRWQDPNRAGQQLASFSQFDESSYLTNLASVASDLFGDTSDPNACAVRKWVTDSLFLANTPPEYLVLTSDQLPQESIRTFCIDPVWLSFFVDGALSLANHYSKRGDHDAVRAVIKAEINKYLGQPPLPTEKGLDGPPRWGILIRSSLVTSFPDLAVDALSSGDQSSAVRTPFLVRKIAPDITICFSNLMPNDADFAYMSIMLPVHRPMFEVGYQLTSSQLLVDFKLPPVPGASNGDGGVSSSKTWDIGVGDLPYDWETSIVNPALYAQQLLSTAGAGSDATFSSSTLALLLGRPIPCLTLASNTATAQSAATTSSPAKTWTGPWLFGDKPVSVSTPRPGSSSTKASASLSVSTKIQLSPLTSQASINLPKPAASTSESLSTSSIVLPLLSSQALLSFSCPVVTNVTGIYTPNKLQAITTTNICDTPPSGSQDLVPSDLVFSLYDTTPRPTAQPNLDSAELQIQVILPVTGTWPQALDANNCFSVEVVPQTTGAKAQSVLVDTSQPTLLLVGGTLNAPHLPTVRSLDLSRQWVFKRYLAVAQMYPSVQEGSLSSIGDDAPFMLVLVVEGRTRDGIKMTGTPEDASFILEASVPWVPKTQASTSSTIAMNVTFQGQDTVVQSKLITVSPSVS
ncbi:hypothetical protein IL306_000310 [Fusarium sp. DS 682]|nr:hypothetical protein IL306_000310 [Fusarium sp. DS 682]